MYNTGINVTQEWKAQFVYKAYEDESSNAVCASHIYTVSLFWKVFCFILLLFPSDYKPTQNPLAGCISPGLQPECWWYSESIQSTQLREDQFWENSHLSFIRSVFTTCYKSLIQYVESKSQNGTYSIRNFIDKKLCFCILQVFILWFKIILEFNSNFKSLL